MDVNLIFNGSTPEVKRANILKKIKKDCSSLKDEMELEADVIKEEIESKTLALASKIESSNSSGIDLKSSIRELISLETQLESNKKVREFKSGELDKIIKEIDKILGND